MDQNEEKFQEESEEGGSIGKEGSDRRRDVGIAGFEAVMVDYFLIDL